MSAITKIFKSGGSQAVRIPKEFRLPGKEVRIRQMAGGGLLIEPLSMEFKEWKAFMRAHLAEHGPFPDDIPEPDMPADDICLE